MSVMRENLPLLVFRWSAANAWQQSVCLVAPGLHDGELLLSELQSYIEKNPDKEFIVKPHPRGEAYPT